MKEKIVEALKTIEKMEAINIIYACESGSRAWGFASPDSDYDVRFIYTRRPEDYFTVFPYRDIIDRNKGDERTSEYIRSLEKKDIDIVGFDVRKVMLLISRCNPGVSEWLKSNIIYMEKPQAWLPIQSLSNETFKFIAALSHYVTIASSHFYKNSSSIPFGNKSLKHYLYTIRAILSCQYIANYQEYPPIEISEMYSNPRLFPEGLLDIDLCKITENFVQKKTHSQEVQIVEPNQKLDKNIKLLIDKYIQLESKRADAHLSVETYAKINSTFFNIVNIWALL